MARAFRSRRRGPLMKVAPGKTRLTLTQTYASAADRDFIVKEFGAIEGGKQTLGRLAGYLRANLRVIRAADLIITRVFDARRASYWCSTPWTDPKHVVRWWGPKDFTAPFCKIDLKPGGDFSFLHAIARRKRLLERGGLSRDRRAGADRLHHVFLGQGRQHRRADRSMAWARVARAKCSIRSPSPSKVASRPGSPCIARASHRSAISSPPP